MYYRRKIILALIEEFGNEVEALKLSKLLFLFTRQQEIASFDFVPYKFGCFSFIAQHDLNTLKSLGFVEEKENSWALKSLGYSKYLNPKDKKILEKLKNDFHTFSAKDLIRYTYEGFPYYTLNSTIAENYISKEAIKRNKEIWCTQTSEVVFTIGYEGKGLDHYLNHLIQNQVNALYDVRKNAYSMKYGFSRHQLLAACKNVGIEYIHLPQFGIESNKRQNLNSPDDYANLFIGYDDQLDKMNDDLNSLKESIHSRHRVALTCFEHDQCNCHRGRLSLKLSQLKGWNIPIHHI